MTAPTAISARGATVSARTAPTAHPPDDVDPPLDEPLELPDEPPEEPPEEPPDELPEDELALTGPPSVARQSVHGFSLTLKPPSGSMVVCAHVVLAQMPSPL
jgi:hypothetical protein